ncbi:hypothetical protein DC498_16845 [Terrimonas sp.]|uniref:PDDEXK nuclease domain-containing protein n=1 Tax=Terrimonas sp. TaxID=1914338 RepID=UPI000D524F4D|nr:PDDEXK nuclease domain-containing protein [Terrimonas sp.]PVD51082.1 hypothetical protein DC498_16845 [Terrimonas sp.]
MAFEINAEYTVILASLKEKIRQARLHAALTVNKALLEVYWEIGNTILQQQKKEGWGTKVIDRLIADLKLEFADMKGLSPRNIKYMRAFAEAWPSFPFLQPSAPQIEGVENQSPAIVQAPLAQTEDPGSPSIVQADLAQLSWYHHITLLDKVKDSTTRIFYIQQTVSNGWTRNVMVHQIESRLHERQGRLTNNFKLTLPAYDSELAMQLFKDPYQLDFVMLGQEARERDLENALTEHITKLLLELGDGFAFMGRQKRFEAGGKEFFVDLLFYNTKLRRHIIVELKIGDFEPEFVSKMNVYLGIVDDTIKGEFDNPSIGLILCKTNNKIVAEYALRDTSKPIGIAEYKIAEKLPDDIKGELPSIEEIETRLDEEIKQKQNPTDTRLYLLKEKIKNIKTEEIKTPATFELLSDLYKNGLRALYTDIIDNVKIFDKEFYSTNFLWYCTDKSFNKLEDVDQFWTIEEYLKKISEFNFRARLDGFKKAGTEYCNVSHELKFRIDTFHYSFTLVNYNNQQPFMKKLYHQPLQANDRKMITDLLMNVIMDDIERFLENIKAESK